MVGSKSDATALFVETDGVVQCLCTITHQAQAVVAGFDDQNHFGRIGPSSIGDW